MTDQFDVYTEVRHGRTVVVAQGEIDIDVAGRLRDALHQAQRQGPEVVADLAGVTFIDSSGINVLVGAHKAEPGRFHVVGARPSVRRVFEILKIADLLILEDSDADAPRFPARGTDDAIG